MRILTASHIKTFMREFPNGGIVFAKYVSYILNSVLMVTDGKFGAKEVISMMEKFLTFGFKISLKN